MAVASLLIKIAADTGNLKSGVDAATSQLDRLQSAASKVGDRLAAVLPAKGGIADGAKSIAAGVGDVVSSMSRLSGAIGGLAVGALISDFLDTTSQLTDLNAQTDISIRALQRFKFAGDLVGISLEQIAAAVGQLQNRLGSLDASALKGLKQLGLTLEEISDLDPGAQFELIASKLSQIKDPAQRAAVAMDLFGRTGIALMPLLRTNLREVGDEAERLGAVMSDKTVASGDRLGDAWVRLKAFGRSLVAQALTPLLEHLDKLDSEKARAVSAFDAIGLSVSDLQKDIQDLNQWVVILKNGIGSIPNLPKAPSLSGGLPTFVPSMSLAEADQLASKLDDQLKEINARAREAKRAADQVSEAIRGISNRINGVDLVGKARLWAEALKAPGAAAKVLADVHLRRELGDVIAGLEAKFGSLAKAGVGSLQGIGTAITALGAQAETIGPSITTALSAITLAGLDMPKMILPELATTLSTSTIDDITATAVTTGQTFGTTFGAEVKTSLQTSLSNIPKVLQAAFTGGGGLSGAFKAIGVMLAESILTPIVKGLSAVQNTAISTGSALAAALGGQAGGGTIGTIAGIASGLGGAAIAATSWGTAMAGAGVAGTVALGAATLGIGAAAVGVAILIKKLTDTKGRDAVKTFAESFGGFDTLHAKLGELGTEGEALWIKLTQGVGKNNPKQAAEVIKEITAAFEALRIKQDEAGTAAQDTSEKITQAQLETLGTLKNTIDELSQEYDRLFQSIASEAPEEVMGVIEQQTRDRMQAIANERTATEHELDRATQEAAAGFAEVTGAAEESARDIERAFENVTIRPIRVPFDFSEMHGGGFEVPELARGGIVRRPTLALIGEAGPEAVVPLSNVKNGGFGGGDIYLTNQNIVDGKVISEYTEKVTKRMAASGRLRPRVTAGRSY